MNEVWIALIGIAGTITAVLLTTLLQQRAAERGRQEQERARLGDLRARAIIEFASATVEYRRAELNRWYHKSEMSRPQGQPEDRFEATDVDVRTARTQAQACLFRVRLLWGGTSVTASAEQLLRETAGIQDLTDRDLVQDRGRQVRQQLAELVDTSGDLLGLRLTDVARDDRRDGS
jgi:hypothetical protein